MTLTRRVAVLCATAGLAFGGLTATANADSASHRLHQAKARAARLDAAAKREAGQIRAAQAKLASLDAQANKALAALQAAAQFAAKMQAAQQTAEATLAAANQRTEQARGTLDQLAANAYRSQASGGSFAATLSLVDTSDPSTIVEGLNLLDQVGKTQSQALDELRLAEGQQHRATVVAAQATSAAMQAEQGAQTAKRAADSLVTQQQSTIRSLNALLAGTRAAAASAHRTAKALAKQIAAARARAAAIRRAQALAARTMPVAGCDGGSVGGYPNGELPVAALCPLWGAPGEMLQAAASAAFNRMSQAFNGAFGEPLCVTASYRTYEHQVELYATMPAGYAAVPGTSNHGWGLAVDLCGGIQVDNSPEHQWLLDHAAVFGWFHPAWAMPGGAGPHEPWHWEYAG